MAKLDCAICGRQKDESTMKVIETTAKERSIMSKMGEKEPKDSYAYCRSCMSILSNKTSALSFMQGLIQVRARAQGVSPVTAEKVAGNFTAKLLEKKPMV